MARRQRHRRRCSEADVAYSFSDNDKLSLGGYWASGANYTTGVYIRRLVECFNPKSNYRSTIGPGGEWSLQGEYWHRFNEKLAASIGVVYIGQCDVR